MTKISVIVPVYNVEKYLCRCIDSILAQDYSNLEIILVNDGSTDQSGIICDEYARRFKKIKVIHKENGGNYSARNTGLNVATGDYVGFIDSDDYICNDMFSYLFKLMSEYDADVVSASYRVTTMENFDFKHNFKEKIDVVRGMDILPFYLKQDKIHSINDYSVCSKLYRKQVFERIRFESGELFEDVLINFNILSTINVYVKTSKVVYAYYQSSESVTRSKLSQRHLSAIDCVKKMMAINKDLSNKELTLLLNRKLSMTYFSLLAKYVRYGTDNISLVSFLCVELRKSIKNILFSNVPLFVKILSLFLCVSPRFVRGMFIGVKYFLCFKSST